MMMSNKNVHVTTSDVPTTPIPRTNKSDNSVSDDENRTFYVDALSMRDASTRGGEVLWSCEGGPYDEAHLPARILQCAAVERSITFTSTIERRKLRLRQRLRLGELTIEEWSFNFGFVMPKSTNTWGTIVEARGPDQMIAPEVLSGNLEIETVFLDADDVIYKMNTLCFYGE
eukprot:PhM_4_TR15097/c0_g1_i1/m.71830/K13758/PDE6D; retinal rod rhodopsin-sensitive cGMP 3',5'-cyclic phosphodiesterase subunit delta